MRAKFAVFEQTQGLHLLLKFHLNVFIVSACNGQKPQFWANFDIFGSSCTDPILSMRAKFGVLLQTPGIGLPAKFRLDGSFCHPVVAKYPTFCSNFCRFFGLRHLVLSPIGISLTKLNTCAQLQTFPYPTASKSFLYSNAFMVKSGAQSLTFKSVTNRQTDKQKNSTFLATPGAREIRAPPNLAW